MKWLFETDSGYRVEVPLSDPLAQALRPSKELIERLKRQEWGNAQNALASRDTLFGIVL